MGTVWRAHDELLGRQVAVKQIVPPADADEGRSTSSASGRCARGGSPLGSATRTPSRSTTSPPTAASRGWSWSTCPPAAWPGAVRRRPLRPELVAQIGAQVADALAATHAAGIVHRDVKPANVLVGQGGDVEGMVKITDFGISHAIGDVTLTQTGQITGTPAFLAPEVAQGAEMSEASDVFSLGATLYTCLEGEPPFGMDDNALRLLHRVAGGSCARPAAPGSLTAPLMEMLAVDPAARPTMPEARDRLARQAAGRDGDPTTVLLARTAAAAAPGRTPTASLPGRRPAGGGAPAAAPTPTPIPTPAPPPPPRRPPPHVVETPAHEPARLPGGRPRWPPLVAGGLVAAAPGRRRGGVAGHLRRGRRPERGPARLVVRGVRRRTTRRRRRPPPRCRRPRPRQGPARPRRRSPPRRRRSPPPAQADPATEVQDTSSSTTRSCPATPRPPTRSPGRPCGRRSATGPTPGSRDVVGGEPARGARGVRRGRPDHRDDGGGVRPLRGAAGGDPRRDARPRGRRQLLVDLDVLAERPADDDGGAGPGSSRADAAVGVHGGGGGI